MAISKEKLVDILDDTDNDLIKTLAKDKIAEEFQGDEVAQKMIQLSQLLSMQSMGADIDEDEVRRIVRDEIQTDKITNKVLQLGLLRKHFLMLNQDLLFKNY